LENKKKENIDLESELEMLRKKILELEKDLKNVKLGSEADIVNLQSKNEKLETENNELKDKIKNLEGLYFLYSIIFFNINNLIKIQMR
jgi:cell division protein FtsB